MNEIDFTLTVRHHRSYGGFFHIECHDLEESVCIQKFEASEVAYSKQIRMDTQFQEGVIYSDKMIPLSSYKKIVEEWDRIKTSNLDELLTLRSNLCLGGSRYKLKISGNAIDCSFEWHSIYSQKLPFDSLAKLIMGC